MNNGLITNCLKAFTLTALLTMLLSTAPLAPATSAAQISANPKTFQELKIDSLNLEFLRAKRSEAETTKGIADTIRKQIIGQLDQAISFIEEKDRLEEELQSFTKQVQQAPDRIKDIKTELSQKTPSFDKKTQLADAPNIPIETIEQRVREEKATLAAARSDLTGWQDQLAKLKTHPPIMQKAIADSKNRIQELKKEIDGIKPSESSEALDTARRAVLGAEQAKLQASIRSYEQALLNHEVLLSLLTAELDLANYRVTTLALKTKAWQEVVQKRRQLEATKARVDAEVAKKIAPDLPKAVKEQYDINITLSRDLEKITTEEARAARILDRRLSESKLLERDFAQAQQLLQDGYLSESMGLSLRRRRQDLPNPGSYRKDSAERHLTISRLSEAQFDLDEKRRNLLDIEDKTQKILKSVGNVSEENRDRLEDTLGTMLLDRRSIVEKLQGNYRRYYKASQSIEFTEQRLAALTEEYANFIDGHLLWIRSSRIIGPKDLKTLPSAIFWILSPHNWWLVLQDIIHSAGHAPLLWIPGLALFVALLLGRRRAKQNLLEIAKNVGSVKKDSFMLTVRALGLTFYLSAGGPFFLVLTGWGLKILPFAGSFSQAAGSGMTTSAIAWIVLVFLYQLCRERGVAQIHFRWPEWSRIALRRYLSTFTPLVLILNFVIVTIESAKITEFGDSLGRLSLIAWTITLMAFITKYLTTAGNALSTSSRGRKESKLYQLRVFWYPLALASPALIMMLAVFGYYYSALVLVPNFRETYWLLFTLIVCNSLALRWLYIARRRLTYEQAVQKRMERLKAEQAKQDTPLPADTGIEIESFDIEEPEISMDQINEQTRTLFQALLIFSTLIGLWTLWDDVLPALNILENFHLWSYSTEIDGVTQVLPITLKSVMIAVVVAAVTFVAARNLPGVLEITLLRYLPLDAGARYAFSAICRYAITTIGVIVTFNYIGVNWASLKWLVAALSVGLGFGLQEIVANFVSGLIILFERPIRVGDLVTVDNVDGVVSKIRIRATTITNWDRKEYIVPNKEFVTGRLLNWTLSNPINRVVIAVGVAYGSDTEKTRALLLKVAHGNPSVLEDPAPIAAFEGFGDNALNFVLRCYLPNFDNWVLNKTELHMAIDREFRNAGITIAFPQRDIHFDTGRPLQIRITSDKQGSADTDLQDR